MQDGREQQGEQSKRAHAAYSIPVKRNPLLDFVAALLPRTEREALERRYEVDPAISSLLLGALEFYLGGKALLTNAMHFFERTTSEIANFVMERMDPRQLDSFDNRLAIYESGAVVWLAWALRPLTWLLLSIPLVGMARMIAFAATRDAIGEPSVWLVVRIARGVGSLIRSLRYRLRFGPLRPDRVLTEPDGLVILSCRPKADWNERITIAVGECFYRLIRVEERPDRGFQAHAYVLKEADPNEIFRGLVRYGPPDRFPSSP